MSTLKRLLLVDDDRSLVSVLSVALADEGYAVEIAHTGLDGLRRFESSAPDLVLLDVLMPEMDGLEVCRRIRKTSMVPIILLTSRGEDVDRVNGLDTGADDYVTKPFSTRELCARIRALGRRAAASAPPRDESPVVRAGELTIDPARFSVTWRGEGVTLTKSEFEILLALVRSAGRVLGRDRLLDLARGDGIVVTDRTVDTYVKRVRQKLRQVDESFDEIETVIGVGYRYRGGA